MPTNAAGGLPPAIILPNTSGPAAPAGDGALFSELLNTAVDAMPQTVDAMPQTVDAMPQTVDAMPQTADAMPQPADAMPQTAGGGAELTVSGNPELAAPEVSPPDLPLEAADATDPSAPLEEAERPSMRVPTLPRRSGEQRSPTDSQPFRVPTVETVTDNPDDIDTLPPTRSDRPRMSLESEGSGSVRPFDIAKAGGSGPVQPTEVAQADAPVPEGPTEAANASASGPEQPAPDDALLRPDRPIPAPSTRPRRNRQEPTLRVEQAATSGPLTAEAVEAPEQPDLPEALRTFEHNDVEPLPGSVKLRGVRGARVSVDLGDGEIVRARVDVQDGEVEVQLRTTEDAALRAEKRVGELREALDEKGLKLARFTVDAEEQERRERRQRQRRQYNPDDEARGGFFRGQA